MKSTDFIQIINEEISNFDFLNTEDLIKEQEVVELLTNEDLQKQFICDSLLRRNDKVKIESIYDSQLTGDWDESNTEDANKMSLLYSLNMEYLYDSGKEPLKFNLHFEATNINISVDGWSDAGNYSTESSGESWFSDFDWGGVSVTMYTMDGDDVNFMAFENAPPRIQTLFIREFVEEFVESQTLEMKTPEQKDSIKNIPYC